MKEFNSQLAGARPGDQFHVRMRMAREAAGLKRTDAADKIGLSSRQLGRIESGAVGMVSDPMTLHRAGAVYGVSDVWLYGGAAAVPQRLIPSWYSDRAA